MDYSKMSDEELLSLLNSGDKEATDVFYKRFCLFGWPDRASDLLNSGQVVQLGNFLNGSGANGVVLAFIDSFHCKHPSCLNLYIYMLINICPKMFPLCNSQNILLHGERHSCNLPALQH